MSSQIIPLTSSPNQSMQVKLAVDGKNLTLNLTFRYNEIAKYWTMRVADAAKSVLIDSVPLLTGLYPAANVLAQYVYLAIGSAYVLNMSSAALDYPDAASLGTDFVLLWGDTPR